MCGDGGWGCGVREWRWGGETERGWREEGRRGYKKRRSLQIC